MLIVVLVGGMVFTQCNQGQNQDLGQRETQVIALGTVGGQVVSLNDVLQGADMMLQGAPMDQGFSPDMLVQAYQAGLLQAANKSVVMDLAKKKGIKITPEEVQQSMAKKVDSQIEGQVVSFRSQMISAKQLKVNATDEEFAKEFKKQTGQELDAAKQRMREQLEAQNKLPEAAANEELSLIYTRLQEAYEASISLSDEEYFKQETKYVTKRIFIAGMTKDFKPVENVWEKISAAKQAVSGGMSFDAAMEKYSEDPAPQGKKKSDSTVNLTLWNMTYDEAYAGVSDLKAGQVSQIVSLADGAAVFRIQEIKPYAKPADWDKQKTALIDARKKEMASKQLNTDMRAMLKPGAPKWESPSAELMVDGVLGLITPEFRYDKKARSAKLKELFERAKGLDLTKEPADPKLVVAARYGIFKQYYDSLTPAEQKAMVETRIEELQNVLSQANHSPTRMELAQLLLDKKDLKGAGEQLVEAANFLGGSSPSAIDQYNDYQAFLKKLEAAGTVDPTVKERLTTLFADWKTSVFDTLKVEAESNADYGPAGQQAFSDLNGRIQDLKSKGLLAPEQAKELETIQAKWREEKVKFDAEEAKKNAEAKANAQDKEKPATTDKPATTGETKTGN